MRGQGRPSRHISYSWMKNLSVFASRHQPRSHPFEKVQVVRTSVPWRYEVQQIDVMAPKELSTAEVYLSLRGTNNNTDVNETSWPITGASLLDPSASAVDLSAALDSLPSAGKVSVTRVASGSVQDSTIIASRHLVTFLSRGGDVPLLYVESSTVTGASGDTNITDTRSEQKQSTVHGVYRIFSGFSTVFPAMSPRLARGGDFVPA